MFDRMTVRSAVLLAGACLALGACKGKENTQSGAVDTGMKADTTATGGAAAGATMSDANIVAVLDKANANDSAGGALAQRQGTNADVKQFGRLMVGEHHALRAEGQALAKKLNLTPEPPATDSLVRLRVQLVHRSRHAGARVLHLVANVARRLRHCCLQIVSAHRGVSRVPGRAGCVPGRDGLAAQPGPWTVRRPWQHRLRLTPHRQGKHRSKTYEPQ